MNTYTMHYKYMPKSKLINLKNKTFPQIFLEFIQIFMYPQMKISNICKIEDIELMTGRQNMGRGLVRQALLNTFSKGLIGSVSQTSNQARFHNTIRIFIIKHTN